MKQIIIVLLIIIALLIGYGKYSEYKRYNSPEVEYKINENIDLSYHNQEIVMNYYDAVEALNSFVMVQWSANEIDVRTPEDDDTETKVAVEAYAKKLAKVKYYEAQLEKSAALKEKGLSNDAIKYLEEKGITIETYKKAMEIDKIKNMFDPLRDIQNKEESVFIFEVQKQLVKNGFDIKTDGVYLIETSEAIRGFEEKNKLFADGKLDVLTLDLLLK